MKSTTWNCWLVAVITLSLIGSAQLAYGTGLASCAPVYGNWCGENYPETGYDPQPVDAWDRACRKHDKCYDAGENKENCDLEFQRKLEQLSRTRIVPQSMVNAHNWFKNDGVFQGFQTFSSTMWALGASCEGGDGRAAEFFCQTPAGSCRLRPNSIPNSSPGGLCRCGGWVGKIGEM